MEEAPPGGTQEAPGSTRRHPGGTRRHQEAPRRHPGGPRRPWTSWKQNVSKALCFFSQSGGGDHFRVHGSDVTITVCSACTQEFVAAWTRKAHIGIPNTEDTPPEPLQQKTVWGIYIYIYIYYIYI